MKASLFAVLCLVCVSCSLFRPNADDTAATAVQAQADAASAVVKKKILVLKFLNHSAYGGEELAAKATADTRNAVLAVTDTVLVPEGEGPPDEGPDALDYNRKSVEEWARAHGVAGIVLGAIEDLQIQESGEDVGLFRARYHTVNATVRVQLIEVGSDRELMSEQSSAEVMEEHTEFLGGRSPESYDAERGKGAVSKALTRSLASLPAQVRKIAWVGRIAKVDLHRYYINAGEESGLTLGQLLKVYGEGVPVIDPKSGTFLGTARGRFKGLLKVIDHFGGDGAVATLHSGGGFREQDRVEIFSPPQK